MQNETATAGAGLAVPGQQVSDRERGCETVTYCRYNELVSDSRAVVGALEVIMVSERLGG